MNKKERLMQGAKAADQSTINLDSTDTGADNDSIVPDYVNNNDDVTTESKKKKTTTKDTGKFGISGIISEQAADLLFSYRCETGLTNADCLDKIIIDYLQPKVDSGEMKLKQHRRRK